MQVKLRAERIRHDFAVEKDCVYMQVDTQRNSVLPKGFYAKYSKIFKTKVESFNIKTFQSIGFVDLFLKEERANRYRVGLLAEMDGKIPPYTQHIDI